MQLLLHPPVQSWCFHGSPLRGFPFSLCTTFILKYLLCLKSWQFFICLQQCFKCFWTDNPKVWNPFFPPLSEPSPAPPASVTPSSGRWGGPGPGTRQALCPVRDSWLGARELPRTRIRRRGGDASARICFPPLGETYNRGHRRDSWAHWLTRSRLPGPGRGRSPGPGRGRGQVGRGRT